MTYLVDACPFASVSMPVRCPKIQIFPLCSKSDKNMIRIEIRMKSGKQKANGPETNPHVLPHIRRRSTCEYHARTFCVVAETRRSGLKATRITVSVELRGSSRRLTLDAWLRVMLGTVPCLPSRVLPSAVDKWLLEYLLSLFLDDSQIFAFRSRFQQNFFTYPVESFS